jgi:diphthamide biosynthesis enzyme Dph1/Dph2-like protein
MAITKTHTVENESYDLQLDDAVAQVRAENAKLVLIQLPDGLKPFADRILQTLSRECPDTQFVFWADSCFGACDAPLHVRHLGFDLLLAFGHAPWRS